MPHCHGIHLVRVACAIVVVSEDDESAYESSPIQTAHFRCELSSRLWSLHTPLDPTKIKPRGYSSMTGGEPKTRERPDQVQDGNPFDIRNRHLTPCVPICACLPPYCIHLRLQWKASITVLTHELLNPGSWLGQSGAAPGRRPTEPTGSDDPCL